MMGVINGIVALGWSLLKVPTLKQLASLVVQQANLRDMGQGLKVVDGVSNEELKEKIGIHLKNIFA